MNIAKGIQGIRNIKAANKTGWHVFEGDKYIGYTELDFTTLVTHYREQFILTGVAGNTLHFTRQIG